MQGKRFVKSVFLQAKAAAIVPRLLLRSPESSSGTVYGTVFVYSMEEPAVTAHAASNASITEPTYTRPVLRNA